MDRGQKIVVAILILAIIFSISSVIISVTLSDLELPSSTPSTHVIQGSDSGKMGISLFVEGNNAGAG